MNSLIVCRSRSHGNTERVARAMAEVLGARLVHPEDIAPAEVAQYDVVGFGSGIYGLAFDTDLRRFVGMLPPVDDKAAFVFATSGLGRVVELPVRPRLATLIGAAGYRIVGTFCCRGFDTWTPLRIVGGLNKGRPDDADLDRARAFARRIGDAVGAREGGNARESS